MAEYKYFDYMKQARKKQKEEDKIQSQSTESLAEQYEEEISSIVSKLIKLFIYFGITLLLFLIFAGGKISNIPILDPLNWSNEGASPFTLILVSMGISYIVPYIILFLLSTGIIGGLIGISIAGILIDIGCKKNPVIRAIFLFIPNICYWFTSIINKIAPFLVKGMFGEGIEKDEAMGMSVCYCIGFYAMASIIKSIVQIVRLRAKLSNKTIHVDDSGDAYYTDGAAEEQKQESQQESGYQEQNNNKDYGSYNNQDLELQKALAMYMFKDTNFTKEQLSDVYRRLMKSFHPDSGTSEDTERAQMINQYHDLLKTYAK